MENNIEGKIPTTELGGQETRYIKSSTDSRNTQAKIVPNEEEKVA